ncbi:hypothetical protein DH2020_014214 [Rehmannia glutinosa]|uniref:Uncharacterized protein n=1 Tax=Rehmannia glutinosa TaxID=99300 RepID=A0ABR0WZ98_REHGL
MGNQVSVALGLQQSEKDLKPIADVIQPNGSDVASSSMVLDKLEYYYVDPVNNQNKFANTHWIDIFKEIQSLEKKQKYLELYGQTSMAKLGVPLNKQLDFHQVRNFEGPSSSRSRMRPSNGVWPEPFVETLAFQVAIDASRTIGRLAAAQALFNIFQNLTRHIWNVRDLIHRNTWRDEYIYRHRTANNFRSRRYVYTTLHFVPTDNNNNNNDGLSCRRLALSDHHLAAGFSDGAVHLFHLSTGVHLSTFYPQHRDRLGRFSSAVSGIILSDIRLVFATLDGDIHMAVVNGATPLRRAHLGDVVNDGALVDFSGCDRWWVGLYAGDFANSDPSTGVPDHAFHIWNSETEELVFIGGTLTDPEAVMGWHLLTELTDIIGRIRVTNHDTAVACTSLRVVVFDLQNQGVVLVEEEFGRGIIVGSFDAVNESALIADVRGSLVSVGWLIWRRYVGSQ